MRVTRYKHDEHYEKLKGWLTAKGLDTPTRDLFSDLGFCVNGIAIGFLFRTQGGQAEIDHVAADPEASPEDRKKALSMLYDLLIREAKDAGYKLITGLASLPAMKERFEAKGFSPYGDFTLYYKWI